MIVSHQKMAQDLKSRKLFYRPEPSSKILAKLQRIVDPAVIRTLPIPTAANTGATVEAKTEPSAQTNRQASAEANRQTGAEASRQSSAEANASRPAAVVRRSNTVRIYVPFEEKSAAPETKDQLDATTRRIEIEHDHYAPKLTRINAATRHSTPHLELHYPSAHTPVHFRSPTTFNQLETPPQIL